MPDLLLELFSEEIPARMQSKAQEDLLEAMNGGLTRAGFDITKFSPHYYVTPRRVALWLKDIPVSQSASETELKGPKVGAPEAAVQGFLKKNSLMQTDLTERDGVYFAIVRKSGVQTADVLKTIIEDILKSFPWPKSMRWGAGDVTWVRPLHSILCIFDGKIVPVEFGGVKAGNVTYGHRFLSPEKITINNPADYEQKLKEAHVIADRDKRRAEIWKQAQKIASAKDMMPKEDMGLLEEVTGLVEWPVVLMGTIDAAFQDLPLEVLISEMRTHQKYFALQTTGGGVVSHAFLITANMKAEDGGKKIIAGNERVLRARLSDGRFFWDQDRKKLLGEWAKGLANVTFHAKLGSIADKVERIKILALQLADVVKADKKLVERAAALCKADLVTGMVGEFPELQGIMGWYYALHQGEKSEVANAIRDHYKPQGPNDSVPTDPIARCIALADKLDTLISMFAIGEKPTGSKDPFALRRAALGVIRIILENNIRLRLKTCFAAPPAVAIALRKANEKLTRKTEAKLHESPASHKIGKYLTINETAYEDVGDAVPPNLAGMLYDFFIDRLKVQMKDSGIRHDVISAVVADGDDDLVRIVARAKAVQDFIGTEDGRNLLAGYKRAANILSIEEKKDKTTYKAADLESSALKETEEKELASLLARQSSHIENLRAKEQFVDAMKHLAGLRSSVDLFFDKTMVNCDDKELRANRLRLLASIRDSMDGIAGFAKVEGSSP